MVIRFLSNCLSIQKQTGWGFLFACVLLPFVLGNLATIAPALAADTCGGQNLLTAMEKSDPAAHARILQEAKATTNGNAVLWRVEREGVAPSLLFGTAHIHDPRLLKFPEELNEALPKASALALELEDFSQEAMGAAMAKLGHLFVFSDGRSLKTLLTPEELSVVERILAPMGATSEVAPLFQPWFVALAMAISPCHAAALATGKLGVDQTLSARAQKAGVKIVGLETIREQMESAAAADIERQVAGLKSSIENYERVDDMTETLVQLYVQRNLTALIPFSIEIAKDKDAARIALVDMKKNLINLRNQRMYDRALPLVQAGGAIIAVGALHLPDEQGLVALFRKSGFSVTAID